MIPKIIHYCWFGKGEKSRLLQKCIRSWKKYCPEYEIIEWNESNIDMTTMPLYTQQAYSHRKWAFVTDYIRLLVVYNYGGIYMDTDVELLRSLNPLLDNKSFFGFEGKKSGISTGLLFGSEAKNYVLKELMEDYMTRSFVRADGSLDTTPAPVINSVWFVNNGIKMNDTFQEIPNVTVVYPSEYFCPLNYSTGQMKKTSNTYSIHHFAASWQDEYRRKKHWREVKRPQLASLYNDYLVIKNKKGFFYALLWYIKQLIKNKKK